MTKFIFDLSIKKHNLLVRFFTDSDYTLNIIKLSCEILNHSFLEISINNQTNYGENLYKIFMLKILEIAVECVIENKKFVIFTNLSTYLEINHDSNIFKEIIKIFEELNGILNSSDSVSFFSKENKKEIFKNLQKKEGFENLCESHLGVVINQRMLSNIKFVLIFENFYYNSSVISKNTKDLYLELINQYPQTFQKFKTKSIEEFNLNFSFIDLDFKELPQVFIFKIKYFKKV